jgi:peptidyl-prolyl cis-trans isomerase C
MRLFKNSFRSIFISAFILVLGAALIGGCKNSEEEARAQMPIIVVGSRTITVKEYKEALDRLLPAELTEITGEELKDLKENVVAQLIEESLLLDEATKLGVIVTDQEVAEEITGIKEASGDSSYEEAILKRYGTMEKWAEEIKRKLLIRKVIGLVIGPRVDITNEAALSYYRENIKEFYHPAQVHARMIVVGTEDEARRIKRTLTPRTFAEVARGVSLSPEAAEGGDLGFFGRGDMPQEFEDVVFKLATGRISDIIKTEYGYHIFLVEARKGRGRIRYREVKEDIKEKLGQESAEREFEAWMISLKESSRIEIKEELL